MTIDKLEKGKTLQDGITYLDDLKKLFGLEEELFTKHPDKFREDLIKNQDKISDEALEFIGKGILNWFNELIIEKQTEFDNL